MSDTDVVKTISELKDKFESAKTVNETKKYHRIEPIDDKKLRFRLYSEDTDFKDIKLIKDVPNLSRKK